MGRKSNHFRHSINANNDPKIMKLKELGGLKAVGAYWTILEIYATSIINDDGQKVEQEVNARHIANAFGLRLDSCQTVIKLMVDCNLIEALWCESDVSLVKLSIPNFLKYFGRYDKTESVKCLNKEKEKKRKEKKDIYDYSFINQIADLWNEGALRHGFAQILKSGDDWSKRKNKLKKLTKQFKTLDDWRGIFSIASEKGFLRNDGTFFTPHFNYVLGKAGEFYEKSKEGESLL